MATDEKNERYRMVLLGDEGVGKTALLVRFLCRRFLGEYDPNIEDVYAKKIEVDGHTIVLEVLDTAVKGMGTSRRHAYMKTANAFIFVYSIDNSESFRSIMKYKSTAELYTGRKDVPFGLVGTKKDLPHLRQVSEEEAETLANAFGWTFYECSSSTDDNVEGIFHTLIKKLQYRSRLDSRSLTKTVSSNTEVVNMQYTRKRSLLTRFSAQFAKTNIFSSHKVGDSKSGAKSIRDRRETVVSGSYSPKFIRDRRRSYSMTSVV